MKYLVRISGLNLLRKYVYFFEPNENLSNKIEYLGWLLKLCFYRLNK